MHITCDAFLTSYQTLSRDTVTTTEGLQYIDVEVGGGSAARFGSVVDINYSLYNLSGSPIESTCPEDATVFRLQVGDPQYILGFSIGISGMQQGGVRRIIVPTHLGYNEVVIFDLELVDIL